MIKKLLVFFKVSYIIILFGIFLAAFGIPSLLQYLDEGVFIKISRKTPSDGAVLAPAVTVCAENPETGKGWKSEANVMPAGVLEFEAACGELDGNDLMRCINNLTYGLEEVFHPSAPDEVENITTDITLVMEGRCHTYLKTENINSQTAALVLPYLD